MIKVSYAERGCEEIFTWRELNPKRVTFRSLEAVINFFSDYQKQYGRDHIAIRLYDLADLTGLSVTTLVKALKDLQESNIIEVIKNKGNNAPKAYVFLKDLSQYSPLISEKEEILSKQTQEISGIKFKLSIYEDFMDRIKNTEEKDGYFCLKVAPAKDGGLGLPLRPVQQDGVEVFDPDNYV